MEISGYCSVQSKEQTIYVAQINVSAKEDNSPKFIAGRIRCEYASTNGCPLPKCSIIEKQMQ